MSTVPRPVEHGPDEDRGAPGRTSSGLLWRLTAGALLVLALGVYAIVVDELPDLTLWWDVALTAFLLIPATMLLAWLALPLRTWDGLAALGIALATVALACAAADLDIVGNFAKALAVILLSLAFLNFFERPWWIALVALAIPLVDALSVWRGPTRHIVTQRPGVFDLLSIAFPVPGGSFQLGLPDVLFFALFLGAAARWRMRVPLSWVLMTASFGATMALALWLDPFGLGGLPALPLLCLAFLLANGDHLLRSLRPAPAEPERHLRAVPDPDPETGPSLAVGIAEHGDGWLAVGLEDGRFAWAEERPTFAEARELGRKAETIGVDAPLAETRLEEVADRLYLGPAARRVYVQFLRELATARDDDEAEAMCRILGWDGVRGESLELRRRALEIREHSADARVVEVDLAAMFAELAGDAPSRGGPRVRHELLARVGVEAPEHSVRAAAAAWSALRTTRGASESAPAR